MARNVGLMTGGNRKAPLKDSGLLKLHERIKDLSGKSTSAGYWASQGTHQNNGDGYSFVDLMKIHEYGEGVKERPLMRYTAYNYRNARQTRGYPSVRKFLRSEIDAKELLDNQGEAVTRVAHGIFGNAILGITNNNTPLVDSGELRDNFSWNTTLDKNKKKLGG